MNGNINAPTESVNADWRTVDVSFTTRMRVIVSLCVTNRSVPIDVASVPRSGRNPNVRSILPVPEVDEVFTRFWSTLDSVASIESISNGWKPVVDGLPSNSKSARVS